jgi:flagellar basal-body rod protein FlgF
MDAITSIAASGMRARTETLDLLANNIANSATAGYKADGEAYDLYFGDSAWQGYTDNRPANSEMPLISKSWTNYSQGTIVETGNAADVAISGEGFFSLNTETGPVYTRSGHFRLAKNGQMQTQEGYVLLDNNGKAIQLDPAKGFSIAKGGQISQGNVPVSTIAVVVPDAKDAIVKRGGAYFTLSPDGKMVAAANTELFQGKIESSNVESTQSSVKLVGVLRQFEMMQRAMRIASDMSKQAVEQVAKVG